MSSKPAAKGTSKNKFSYPFGAVLGSVLKLDLGTTLLTPSQALALLAFIAVSAASGVPAGLLAYRTSLQDGMRARF